MYVTNKGESIRKSAYVCCVDLQKVFDTVEVTDAFKIPCDRIKKIRVSENGGLNQSKHQNSTIQATRFFFLFDRTLLQKSGGANRMVMKVKVMGKLLSKIYRVFF
jgi:hypothetical protein